MRLPPLTYNVAERVVLSLVNPSVDAAMTVTLAAAEPPPSPAVVPAAPWAAVEVPATPFTIACDTLDQLPDDVWA
jgi:hypothetical protein